MALQGKGRPSRTHPSSGLGFLPACEERPVDRASVSPPPEQRWGCCSAARSAPCRCTVPRQRPPSHRARGWEVHARTPPSAAHATPSGRRGRENETRERLRQRLLCSRYDLYCTQDNSASYSCSGHGSQWPEAAVRAGTSASRRRARRALTPAQESSPHRHGAPEPLAHCGRNPNAPRNGCRQTAQERKLASSLSSRSPLWAYFLGRKVKL